MTARSGLISCSLCVIPAHVTPREAAVRQSLAEDRPDIHLLPDRSDIGAAPQIVQALLDEILF